MQSKRKVSKGLALEQEVWEKIDEVKPDDVTASAWVRRVVKKELGLI